MNQCDPPKENAGPESTKDHLAECPWCAEEMAEDQELMGLIQQSLWDSLAHQSPSPEVWDRIRARLPERKQVRWSDRLVWTWPRLLSDAVVVGLLLALVGLALLRPPWASKRDVPSLPTASQTDDQVEWRGVEEQVPEHVHENGEPTVSAMLPGGTGLFDAMTSEGLLNVGYLYRLKRGPARWEGPARPGSAVTGGSGARNLLP